MHAPRWLLVLSVMGASGCSWSRFDEVTDHSPIVLFSKPGSMKQGFGVSLATATSGGNSRVLVGGAVGVSRAAAYDIGDVDSPGTTSTDSGYCTGDGACFLSSSLAGLGQAKGPDQERPLCFAVGVGAVGTIGIVIRCQDTSDYTLKVPSAAQRLLQFSIDNNQPYDYPLASDRSAAPVLLAALPYNHSAWFYPAKSLDFVPLIVPAALSDDPSFGTTLSVLEVGEGRVLALGVPGKSEVLLWKSDGGRNASYIGCLGGIPGFGRALAAGNVNKDENADLVVSDATNVNVIDGRALFDLPEVTTDSAECGFSSLPANALLGSFGCGSSTALSGCATSEFGAAVAVGDLDGDGDGEVIVGAPHMKVRDEAGAGAVLVFDAESPSDSTFADAKFLSSAEASDDLGRSLVTPHIAGRDIIVAGAPGNGKVALFYCSPLLERGAAGSRCP